MQPSFDDEARSASAEKRRVLRLEQLGQENDEAGRTVLTAKPLERRQGSLLLVCRGRRAVAAATALPATCARSPEPPRGTLGPRLPLVGTRRTCGPAQISMGSRRTRQGGVGPTGTLCPLGTALSSGAAHPLHVLFRNLLALPLDVQAFHLQVHLMLL